MTKYSLRPLFGGGIFCDIPSEWRDVSDVRQVPDHQEVWQSMQNEVFVVEILERQQVTDASAAGFYFTDLAESNGASRLGDCSFRPAVMPPLTNVEGAVACAGFGFQKVTKGRDLDTNGRPRENQEICWTSIELCVLRLPHVETDLLVTITKPSSNFSDGPTAVADSSVVWSNDFQRVVSSLQVRDWGLFG